MMTVKRKELLAASLLVTLVLTGCKREATGQVAAVVNGEEITLQEINAELGDSRLAENVDRKEVQKSLLQRIIDRRLVALAARNDKIDSSQDYLIKRRQLDDELLVRMLGQRVERTYRIPDRAEIDKYIASQPTMFGQRTVYTVDRILFPTPEDANVIRALKDDHTMDAVAARLDSFKIKYARGPMQMDSAALPPEMLKRILALPAGEPFAVPQQGSIAVAVITASTSAPMSGDAARPLAVQLMRKAAVDNMVQQRLKAERAAAKIEYQPGFEPKAKAPAPSAAKS